MTVDRIQMEIAIKHDKARQEIADITERLQGETKQLKELDKAKRITRGLTLCEVL